jgi:hypothetical protein
VKESIKVKLAKATNSKTDLNKKALQLKKSWEEVDGLLRTTGKKNKNGS